MKVWRFSLYRALIVVDRSNIGRVVRTAGWFTVARLLTAASAAVAGLLAASELGPAGRGEVAVGLLIGYIAAVVALRGLENSLPPVAAGEPFERSFRAALAFLAPGLAAIAVVTVAGVGLGLGWDGYPAPSALAVGLVAVGTALGRAAAAAGVASGDMRRQPVLTGGSGIVLVVGAVGLAVAGGSSPWHWLMLYAVSSLLGVVAARLPLRPSAEHRRQLAAAARPGLAATLTSFLSLRADRLLLPLLADTTELGLYVVASTIVDLGATPGKALSQALVSRWKLIGPPPLAQLAAGATLVSGALAVGLWAFGRWAILVALGDVYRRSADLLAVLAVAMAVQLVGRAVSSRLLALERHWAVGTAESVGLAAGLVVYVVAIPGAGATGAALGSLAAYSTTTAVALWFSRAGVGDRPVAAPAPPR